MRANFRMFSYIIFIFIRQKRQHSMKRNEITIVNNGTQKKHVMTMTLYTSSISSKTVTTRYYNEQRFSLSNCQLSFRTVCKYSFRESRKLLCLAVINWR